MSFCRTAFSLTLMMVLSGAACRSGSNSNSTSQSQQGNDLDAMAMARVSIKDSHFEVWLARDNDQREKGLMFVTAEQMQPLEDGTDRAMLFVFDHEKVLHFYMRNTIIPLDIAYARTDGTIVKIHTMTPLDESLYSSMEPARFALEVKAGLFAGNDIKEGDQIVIPDSVLNP